MPPKRKEPEKLPYIPVPYKEPEADSKEHFWPEDPWDENLPSTPGFINDFVAHMRGYETPTAYCIWAAIFYISSVIKREAWIEWGYGKLFSNFFILLVGPPGIVKKGTTMWQGYDVFKDCRKFISDPNLKEMKRFNVLRNKASAEALVSTMAENRKKHGEHFDFLNSKGEVMLVNGKPVRYHRTSEISIIVPELAVMLSRADYAKPVTTTLMDLYDCHDTWEVTTQIRGKELLTNLCTNFFGGVTPKGLSKSVPEEASEDGFLSRCILVYQKSTNRVYSEPRRVGPSTEELSRKLGWIAEKNLGVQELTAKARSYYDSWYKRWRKELESSERPYASSRMAIQALQLSLVLKASRFSSEPVIEEKDIIDATRLIEKTSGTYQALFSNVESNGFFEKMASVEKKIFSKKRITRRELMVGSRRSADELNSYLSHLHQTGRIKIYRNGTEETYLSKDGKEEYRWRNGTRPLSEETGYEGTDEA